MITTTDEEFEVWVEYGIATREKVNEYKKHRDLAKQFRYAVESFPGYMGNPFYTDSYAAALVVCALRSIGMAEARIIDNRADKHLVVI